ncbi:MAG: pyridoxamine 5'-phosphate oxidase family protein [Telluria sp.]
MEQLNTEGLALVTRILAQADEMTLATIRHDGSPHASTVHFVSEDMVLYAAIALDSGKAHDLGRDGRVALTVNAPYGNWNEIQGLSIDGVAEFITEPRELSFVSALLLHKFPAFKEIILPEELPWPGMLFVRVTPRILTLLDYTRGFGHMETFDMRKQAP